MPEAAEQRDRIADGEGSGAPSQRSSGVRKRSRSRTRTPPSRRRESGANLGYCEGPWKGPSQYLRLPPGSGTGGKRDRRSGGDYSDKLVYISNLSYEIRWPELKDILKEKAGDVAHVEVLTSVSGKPKGSAVVEFRDRESVRQCVDNMNRIAIKDRNIICKEIRDPPAFFRKVQEETGFDWLEKRSISGGGGGGGGGGGDRGSRGDSDRYRSSMRGPPPNRQPAQGTHDTYGLSPVFLRQLGIDGPLCNRVFVANLPYNAQSGKIHDVFSLAGRVTWVDVQLDKEGKSKGLCIVEYSHPIEAVQAISMLNGQRLSDRTMTVKMDRFEAEHALPRRPGDLPEGLRGVGMGLGANGAPLTNVAQLLGGGDNSPDTTAVAALQPSNYSNIGYGAGPLGNNNVASLFAPTPSPLETARGAAMQSASGNYGGGGLSAAAGGLGAAAGGVSMYNQAALGVGGGGGYAGGGGDAFNGAQNIMSMAQPQPSAFSFGGPTRTIIIRNLPVDYTWQMVRDRLSRLGEIDLADMVAPGVAKVRFRQLADAERVRGTLHNTAVEGRTIVVDYDYN